MARQLDAASKLIAGLQSERERWTADLEQLNLARAVDRRLLVGAAFLSYSGAFNFEFARPAQGTWELDLLRRDPCRAVPLEKLLTSDVETARWASRGCPRTSSRSRTAS